MKLYRWLIVCFLFLLLSACSNQPVQLGLTGTPKATETLSAYPAGAITPGASSYPASIESAGGYLAPQSTESLPEVVSSVTPDSTKATVTGILFSAGKPVENIPLYLARVLKDSSGKEITLSLDKVKSPSAITDSQGKFVFYNVPLDTYGLILDNGTVAFVLTKPDSTTGEQIRVLVMATEPMNIGSLNYANLLGN
jgi:hypothetical protein